MYSMILLPLICRTVDSTIFCQISNIYLVLHYYYNN